MCFRAGLFWLSPHKIQSNFKKHKLLDTLHFVWFPKMLNVPCVSFKVLELIPHLCLCGPSFHSFHVVYLHALTKRVCVWCLQWVIGVVIHIFIHIWNINWIKQTTNKSLNIHCSSADYYQHAEVCRQLKFLQMCWIFIEWAKYDLFIFAKLLNVWNADH